MNRIPIILGVFALLALSCKTISSAAHMPAPAPAERQSTPMPTTLQATYESPRQCCTPTVAFLCRVETGLLAGTVNIRSGPGMDFPVVGVASQGEDLRLTHPGESEAGWVEVTTGDGLQGYFYAPTWCDIAPKGR